MEMPLYEQAKGVGGKSAPVEDRETVPKILVCDERKIHRQQAAEITSTALRPIVPDEELLHNVVSHAGCLSISKLSGVQTFEVGKAPPPPKECDPEYKAQMEKEKELLKHIFGSDKSDKPCFPFPGEGIKYTPYGESRQDELFQVGYPFATEAVRWMECNIDPLVLPTQKERKLGPWNVSNL